MSLHLITTGPGCREGAELSAVLAWPGRYSIPLTWLPGVWLQGEGRGTRSRSTALRLGLSIGGDTGISPGGPILCRCLSPSHSCKTWLGDVALPKRWTRLQAVVLGGGAGVGSSCREQSSRGKSEPSQVWLKLKGAEQRGGVGKSCQKQ